VPELDNEHIRERFVYNYRMIYRSFGPMQLIDAFIERDWPKQKADA